MLRRLHEEAGRAQEEDAREIRRRKPQHGAGGECLEGEAHGRALQSGQPVEDGARPGEKKARNSLGRHSVAH